MSDRVYYVDDLHPDGVRIVVNWDDVVVGSSIFVPCINTTVARSQAQNVAARRKWTIKVTPRIENQLFGVRIWRTT